MPSADTLTMLSKKYNVSINWLLTGKGKMFISTGAKEISEEEMMKMDYSGKDSDTYPVSLSGGIPDDITKILIENPELFQHIRRYSNLKQNQAPGEKIKIKWSFEFE